MSGRHLFLNKGGDPRTFKIKYFFFYLKKLKVIY
jgi:hypothetical protein